MEREEFKRLWEIRRRGFEAHAQWERENAVYLSPARALEIIDGVYRRVPPEVRCRPTDVEGIARMRRCLALIGKHPK